MDHLIWNSLDPAIDTDAQGQRIAANEVPEHRWSENPGWVEWDVRSFRWFGNSPYFGIFWNCWDPQHVSDAFSV